MSLYFLDSFKGIAIFRLVLVNFKTDTFTGTYSKCAELAIFSSFSELLPKGIH